jgi:hypothetical protein
MSDLLSLNLIRFLNFYLTVMALASLYRRSQQYQMIGSLAMSGPSRWPRLIELIRQHYGIFMTWGTIRPVLAAGVLLLANFIASRFIWPTATLTLGDLLTEWYYMPVVVITGLAMLTMDCYSLIVVNTLNREELEKHLDYAEHWLTTWKAPIIRFVTLGYVDPRRMVDSEVRKALEATSRLVNKSLWWTAGQAALRVAFGLSLWIGWAILPTLQE